MTPRWWSRIGGLGAILAVLAAVLVATVWLQSRQLSLVDRAVNSGEDYSVLSIYQVEFEYLRLRDQWRRALTEPEPDLEALRLRYDIWVSRIELARTRGMQTLMAREADYLPTLVLLEAFVARADQWLGSAPTAPPDAPALAALLPALDALAEPVHALTLDASHESALRADERHQDVRQLSRLGITMTAVLFVLMAAFALLAVRQMRQLRDRRQAIEDLAKGLQQARQAADAANQAKSVFLAHMSHGIRTPFQGLLGMLSLLRESGLSARQAEHLRIATESADHLLDILNDILDLSQLESGGLTLSPAPTDPRALLSQVEAVMRPQAAAKSLRLHVDTEPTVPERVLLDATRVKQVLYNLLSNAIKFSDRGTVAVDLRVPPGPRPVLRFVVTDTGMGMDQATVTQLFGDPDGAVAPAPRRSANGAGLGLEISRNLVKLMAGALEVESVTGEGSVFRFDLPLQALPAEPTKPEARPATCAPARALSVLVAEDHAVNRQYLAALLEGFHHRAHFVGSGREAVQAVREQSFDIVLMDLHMPDLDGVAAAREIRALPNAAMATVPIIALTADAFPQTRERCLLAGMNDFLPKPVSPEDLAAALRRLFGHDAVVAAVQPPSDPSIPPPQEQGDNLIDMAAIDAALRGIPRARLATLIDEFLDQGPRTVARMRTAVREGQALELRVHAHAVCGAALNLGLTAIAHTAQTLHEGAAYLPAHEIARLVQSFEDLIPRTREAASQAGLL